MAYVWTKEDGAIRSGEWLVGPRPTEDMLAAAYLTMRENGTMDLVCHQSKPDLRWWLNWLLGDDCYTPGIYRCDGDRIEMVGTGFFNNVQTLDGLTKAESGFAFIEPERPGVFVKIELVRALVRCVFEFTPIESLLGLTPERNPGAAVMMKRAGLRQFGPIPNYCTWHGAPCGAYISQTDKQTWFNRE